MYIYAGIMINNEQQFLNFIHLYVWISYTFLTASITQSTFLITVQNAIY